MLHQKHFYYFIPLMNPFSFNLFSVISQSFSQSTESALNCEYPSTGGYNSYSLFSISESVL